MSDITPDIARGAVAWLVELQTSDTPDATLHDIQVWCRQHPEHERAWQHIEHLNRQFSALATPEQAALVQTALTASGISRRRTIKALSVLLFTAAGSYAVIGSDAVVRWRADYYTAVGEQRTLTLEDGTELTLNSNSAVNIDYTANQRRIVLEQGEIYLQTGSDEAARPMRVSVSQGTMQPLGTRFAVRQFDRYSRLSVFDGSVKLTPSQNIESIIVEAGHGIEFNRSGWSQPGVVDEREAAWRRGIIIAKGMPLAEFIGELSRYRHGILRVDPDITDLKVSGTYPIAQTDQVLQVLSEALPISLQSVTRYWVTLVPAEAD